MENKFQKKASFDFSKFSEVAAMAMRLSDDLVELELEKLDNILEVCDTDDEKVLWRSVCKNH